MELRGDLHVHTGRSPDSRAELAALVAAANRAGLDFIALTDHDLPPGGGHLRKTRAGRGAAGAGHRVHHGQGPPAGAVFGAALPPLPWAAAAF